MAYPGFRHLGLKLLSIMLAALMWVLVAGEQVVERAMRIPLEFTNLPAELEIVGDTIDVVDVRVRGSSGTLGRIPAGELVAVLDLRTARAGRRLFHLGTSDVRAPFGVNVVQIAPSNVPVTLERAASKMVPVVPELDGEPADGFIVGTTTAAPAMVEVLGPASAIERLAEAITEPVSIAGASSTVVEAVNVGVEDPTVRLRSAVSARVTVTIDPAPVEWAVANVPVKATGSRQVEIVPAEVLVYVRGPREARNAGANAADFSASVDAAGLDPGTFQLPVSVVPPARVGVLRVEPPIVRVRVR